MVLLCCLLQSRRNLGTKIIRANEIYFMFKRKDCSEGTFSGCCNSVLSNSYKDSLRLGRREGSVLELRQLFFLDSLCFLTFNLKIIKPCRYKKNAGKDLETTSRDVSERFQITKTNILPHLNLPLLLSLFFKEPCLSPRPIPLPAPLRSLLLATKHWWIMKKGEGTQTEMT